MGNLCHTLNMVANGVTATGLAWGPNKGHIVEPLPKRVRASEKKGRLGVKVKLARDVVREVGGFAPYERRCMELLSQGFDKRALKFCKKRVRAYTPIVYLTVPNLCVAQSWFETSRALTLFCGQLGPHRRGKKKRAEMEEVLQAQKLKGK